MRENLERVNVRRMAMPEAQRQDDEKFDPARYITPAMREEFVRRYEANQTTNLKFLLRDYASAKILGIPLPPLSDDVRAKIAKELTYNWNSDVGERPLQLAASWKLAQMDEPLPVPGQRWNASEGEIETLRNDKNWFSLEFYLADAHLAFPDRDLRISDAERVHLRQELSGLKKGDSYYFLPLFARDLRILGLIEKDGITQRDWKRVRDMLPAGDVSDDMQVAAALTVLAADTVTVDEKGLHLSNTPKPVAEKLPPVPAASHLP